MNEKDTKVPVYIAIIVAVILVAAACFYVLGVPSREIETPVEMPPVAAPIATIKCELCHTDSQNLAPHLAGGKLCINCHGSQVHSIHVGSGTIDMKCDSCHGPPQKITIPKVEKGEGPGHFSTCEQCHAPPPDSLKPSKGELVMIHLSRGTYCTNCHGADVRRIHEATLGNKTK
ncbi:hypothetical protein ig2599ANME_1355 [groundwater metagenome]